MRARLAVIAAVLCAAAARADDPRPPPVPVPVQAKQPPPLSREDEEMLKELALLERLDLVKNLELFEQDKEADSKADLPEREP